MFVYPCPCVFAYDRDLMTYIRGVDKFFKTLAKLATSSVFSLAKSENNWPKL
jgi:hypothetical protein